MGKISFKTISVSIWKDFEKLFKSKKILANCWCMAWRMTKEEQKSNTPSNRKKFIKSRVDNEIPIGLLGYDVDEPVAWCSIAPRETHSSGLGGDESIENVWSITCFFIKPEYRDKGLLDKLIAQAVKLAKSHKAAYVEATPVKFDSPSYKNMGNVESFHKAGFSYVKMVGKRRYVMVKKI